MKKMILETSYPQRLYSTMIRPLVDNSFVPANQQTSILHRRLSDLQIEAGKPVLGDTNQHNNKRKKQGGGGCSNFLLYLLFYDKVYQNLWQTNFVAKSSRTSFRRPIRRNSKGSKPRGGCFQFFCYSIIKCIKKDRPI